MDADKHRDLGGRFGVTGFPTLKWFPAGSKEPEAYSGGRSAPDLVDFVNKKIGTNLRTKTAPTAVTVLDPYNFDQVVLDNTKDVLVEFYGTHFTTFILLPLFAVLTVMFVWFCSVQLLYVRSPALLPAVVRLLTRFSVCLLSPTSTTPVVWSLQDLYVSARPPSLQRFASPLSVVQ